jgi:hypothetical protein
MAADPARAALIGGGVGGAVGFIFGLAITYASKPRKTLMGTQELALLGGLAGAGVLFGACINAGMNDTACSCTGAPLARPPQPGDRAT